MNKTVLIIFLFLFSFCYVQARSRWPDKRMTYPIFRDVTVSPLQISAWPLALVPDDTESADIYGLNLNLTTFFHAQRTVVGVSCGLTQISESHYGFSAALYNGVERNGGLSVGLINSYSENYGVCVGAFNIAMGGTSTITERDGKKIVESPYNPNILQLGICNFAREGIQFGLFNLIDRPEYSREEHGFSIQFGLLNHDPKAWIPWMPVFNFSFPDKK